MILAVLVPAALDSGIYSSIWFVFSVLHSQPSSDAQSPLSLPGRDEEYELPALTTLATEVAMVAALEAKPLDVGEIEKVVKDGHERRDLCFVYRLGSTPMVAVLEVVDLTELTL